MTSIEDWLCAWFRQRNGGVPAGSAAGHEVNYFESGWIDSMGVIDLVAEVEGHFGIQFAHEDFQDRRFPTIGGLAELIREKQEGSAS